MEVCARVGPNGASGPKCGDFSGVPRRVPDAVIDKWIAEVTHAKPGISIKRRGKAMPHDKADSSTKVKKSAAKRATLQKSKLRDEIAQLKLEVAAAKAVATPDATPVSTGVVPESDALPPSRPSADQRMLPIYDSNHNIVGMQAVKGTNAVNSGAKRMCLRDDAPSLSAAESLFNTVIDDSILHSSTVTAASRLLTTRLAPTTDSSVRPEAPRAPGAAVLPRNRGSRHLQVSACTAATSTHTTFDMGAVMDDMSWMRTEKGFLHVMQGSATDVRQLTSEYVIPAYTTLSSVGATLGNPTLPALMRYTSTDATYARLSDVVHATTSVDISTGMQTVGLSDVPNDMTSTNAAATAELVASADGVSAACTALTIDTSLDTTNSSVTASLDLDGDAPEDGDRSLSVNDTTLASHNDTSLSDTSNSWCESDESDGLDLYAKIAAPGALRQAVRAAVVPSKDEPPPGSFDANVATSPCSTNIAAAAPDIIDLSSSPLGTQLAANITTDIDSACNDRGQTQPIFLMSDAACANPQCIRFACVGKSHCYLCSESSRTCSHACSCACATS